jgi:hypothetical protein
MKMPNLTPTTTHSIAASTLRVAASSFATFALIAVMAFGGAPLFAHAETGDDNNSEPGVDVQADSSQAQSEGVQSEGVQPLAAQGVDCSGDASLCVKRRSPKHRA